jgi:hypothetical protein
VGEDRYVRSLALSSMTSLPQVLKQNGLCTGTNARLIATTNPDLATLVEAHSLDRTMRLLGQVAHTVAKAQRHSTSVWPARFLLQLGTRGLIFLGAAGMPPDFDIAAC